MNKLRSEYRKIIKSSINSDIYGYVKWLEDKINKQEEPKKNQLTDKEYKDLMKIIYK